MKRANLNTSPFKQEAPYGTRKKIAGVEYVYMPDPWTFPEGYGNAWCSIPELIKDGLKFPNEKQTNKNPST